MAIVQSRVEDDLKIKATRVYDNLGIDLSTAIRMFLKKSVAVNGIPFSVINEENNALDAISRMNYTAAVNKTSNMTLDQINEEIFQYRAEKKK